MGEEKRMDFFNGSEMIDVLSNKAEEKRDLTFSRLLILGILGGVFIALGYLSYVRVVGSFPADKGYIGSFLGASLFSIGLIGISLLGLELATGNVITMSFGYLNKKVCIKDVIFNWIIIGIANILGAVIVAYLFGHVVGLTEGDFSETVVNIANTKVNTSYSSMIISGVGANVFVSIAIWMGSSTKNFIGKIFGLWFPIMIFVLVGLQHSIANAFIIPAAIFTGKSEINIVQFVVNFSNVFLGNIIGGLIVSIPTFMANKRDSFGSHGIPHTK